MLFVAFLFFLLSPILFESWVIEATNVPRFLIASLFLAFGWMLHSKRIGKLLIPSKLIVVLLILFYLLSLLGLFWALNIADLVFESQKIIFGIGLFLFIYNYIQEDDQDNAVVQGVLFALFLVIIITIWDIFSGGKFQSSLFGHKNLLSSFLFLCIPFVLFRFKHLNRTQKIGSLLVILIILAVLYYLNTRTVFLALVISTLCFIVIRWSLNWHLITRKWFFGTLIAGIFVMVGFGLNFINQYKSDINANVQNSSLVERIRLWNKTNELISEHPILGVGTGNWQYNYSKFSVNDIEKARNYNTFFKRPHNDFLWVLSENGIIGFLILLLVFGLIGWHVLKDIFQHKNHSRLILFSAFIGLLVIASFSFPKERMTHICLSTILLVYLIKDVPFFQSEKVKMRPVFIYVFIALMGLNVWIAWQRISGEYYTQKSIQSQARLDADGAIENGVNALSTFYTSDPSGTPILSYIGWGYNRKTDLSNLLEVNTKAYQLSPFDYKVLSNYGYILSRTGQFQLAQEILNEAYRINSNYEPTVLNLSVLEFNQGNYHKSLEWLESIKGYEKKYASNLERIMGRIEGGD